MNKKIITFLMVTSLFCSFFAMPNVSAASSQSEEARISLIKFLQNLLVNNGEYDSASLVDSAKNYGNDDYNYNNNSNYNNNYNRNSLSVFAGNYKTIQSAQSVYLDATVSNQTGYPVNYLWTCTGGSLSNYYILNPIYYAPTTGYDTTYTCTLNISNFQNNSSSSVNILVKGNYNNNHYCYGYNCNNNVYPSISVGAKKSVQAGRSVYLDATVLNQNSYPTGFSWTCTGGTLSSNNILNPVYYAPNVPYDTTYYCTLTASNSWGSSSASLSILVIGSGYYTNYNTNSYYYNNNGYYYNNSNCYYNNGYYNCSNGYAF